MPPYQIAALLLTLYGIAWIAEKVSTVSPVWRTDPEAVTETAVRQVEQRQTIVTQIGRLQDQRSVARVRVLWRLDQLATARDAMGDGNTEVRQRRRGW